MAQENETATEDEAYDKEEWEELLFPKTIIDTPYGDNALVTDDEIEHTTRFGPFPGNEGNRFGVPDWMHYVTSVESFLESNLLICFLNNELYFYCHRLIYKGTELIVWAGQKRMNLHDSSKWELDRYNSSIVTIPCQDCDMVFNGGQALTFHWHATHMTVEDRIDPKPICHYCGGQVTSKTHYRVHILQHGINLCECTFRKKLFGTAQGWIAKGNIATSKKPKKANQPQRKKPAKWSVKESEPTSTTWAKLLGEPSTSSQGLIIQPVSSASLTELEEPQPSTSFQNLEYEATPPFQSPKIKTEFVETVEPEATISASSYEIPFQNLESPPSFRSLSQRPEIKSEMVEMPELERTTVFQSSSFGMQSENLFGTVCKSSFSMEEMTQTSSILLERCDKRKVVDLMEPVASTSSENAKRIRIGMPVPEDEQPMGYITQVRTVTEDSDSFSDEY